MVKSISNLQPAEPACPKSELPHRDQARAFPVIPLKSYSTFLNDAAKELMGCEIPPRPKPGDLNALISRN